MVMLEHAKFRALRQGCKSRRLPEVGGLYMALCDLYRLPCSSIPLFARGGE